METYNLLLNTTARSLGVSCDCRPQPAHSGHTMADIFSKPQRSAVMRAVRSRGNRTTEMKLATILREHGITGWRRHQPLPGRPDFTFRRERLAVFVDGCFWHGCRKHGKRPASNQAYWIPKLARNCARDCAVNRELRSRGWTVLRVWEHSLRQPGRTAARCRRALAVLSVAKDCAESGRMA